MKKRTRNSSIELLRLLSVSGIVMMHCYSLIDEIHASASNIFLGFFINAVCNTGVTCFILTSGYFGVIWNRSKFVELAVLTTIYALLAGIFVHGFSITAMGTLLVIPCYTHWFVACYLLLMLISPYIDVMIREINHRQFKRLLIILFITLSLLPTLNIGHSNDSIVSGGGGKCFTCFVFSYLIGRYIRLYADGFLNRRQALVVFAGCTLLILALNIGGSMVMGKRIINFHLDCSPLIIASSVAIFYFFKSYCFHSLFINSVARSVFAICVMNSIYQFFDREYVSLATHSAEPSFLLYFLFLTVVTWGSCVIAHFFVMALKSICFWLVNRHHKCL